MPQGIPHLTPPIIKSDPSRLGRGAWPDVLSCGGYEIAAQQAGGSDCRPRFRQMHCAPHHSAD